MPAEGPRPLRLLCAGLAGLFAIAAVAVAQEPAAPRDAAPEPWAQESRPIEPAGADGAEPGQPDAAESDDPQSEDASTAFGPAGLERGSLEPDAEADAPPETGADAPGVRNDDVLAMTEAEFSDSTILAVIEANPTLFDISPRALVALKGAGVSEVVIEAMIGAEQAKREAAEIASEPPPAPQPSEEFAKLSAMIERLAARQEAAEAARRAPEPPPSTDSSPRAWVVNAVDKTLLAPTIAKVAFTDEKGTRFKTLQSLAGKALAFVNPAVSGIATTLGGLFRSDNQRGTSVWALQGTGAGRVLGGDTVFEIEFGHTPGVDPDRYQAAIVQLVRTNDNYRLVAAAKTEGTSTVVTSRDPIVEELMPTQLQRLARGHYRVRAKEPLAPGEYALVLRPIVAKERRRKSDTSLGELFGGGTSQILYLTWDFAVVAN